MNHYQDIPGRRLDRTFELQQRSLPDSLFKQLYPALDADPEIRTIRVSNEGEGAGICGGVFLSGKRAVLVMESSGLRASIEPLARVRLGARRRLLGCNSAGLSANRDACWTERRLKATPGVSHTPRKPFGFPIILRDAVRTQGENTGVAWAD